MNPRRLLYMSLAISLVGLGLYSLVTPSLCKSGCGSLSEPLFTVLYWAFSSWGPRVLLFSGALFFAWSAAKAHDE